jgi:hypothetical protein
MAELKFLCEVPVLKQVEEKVTEIKEENGEKVEISKTVKKAKPVKVAILKPNRRLWEAAEIFYAKQIAFYIQQGLLPHSLVAKRYANDGGGLSEPEKQRIGELKTEVEKLQEDLYALIASKEEDKKEKTRDELLIKINNINHEINGIRNSYSEIFENTAEMKSRNKTVEWWVLNLSYINEDGTFKPIFGDGNYDAKILKYDELEEKSDLFTIECIKKLSYLISFWFSSTINITAEDFESQSKFYDSNISDYKVEEDKSTLLIKEVP